MLVTVKVPASDIFPPALSVEVADGVWEPCEPAPVISAVLVREAADVTQVAQLIVPVVVIVPPPIGELVAIEVTDPEPLAAVAGFRSW